VAPQVPVGWEHFPSLRPLQLPPQIGSFPQEARFPWGAPDDTGEQVPSKPGRSQAMHDSPQALLQQYPSGAQVVPAMQLPAV
jgi:hypothetical protein